MDLGTRWRRQSPKQMFPDAYAKEGGRSHSYLASVFFFSGPGGPRKGVGMDKLSGSKGRSKENGRPTEGSVSVPSVSSEPASHLHCSATPVVTGISRPSPGRHGNRSSSKNAGSMAARSARMTRRGILYHPKLLAALHCWAAPVAASISRPSANGHRYSCKHAGLAAARRPHDLTLVCRLALLSCCRRAICSRAPS